jgi:two-component system, NarL family, invasion response regulator UvrY
MRFLIVDDHPAIRKGYIYVITCEPEYAGSQYDEAGTAAEALTLLHAGHYDMVLLDISLPDRSGLEILAHIHKEAPSLPVLVISIHAENLYAIRTLKKGAAGYITKTSAVHNLITALENIRRTGKYISPSVSLLLAHEVGSNHSAHANTHELLSNREMEVARLISSGISTRKIAEQLRLSVKTINTHRSRLLAKLGLKNSVELTTYCIHNHLI